MSEREILKDIWNAMYRGEGTKEDPGILVRLDRVEQRLGVFSWVATTALAAAIAGFVEWLQGKLGGGRA